MRLRNRPTRARRGIALGWVLAILAILVIAIVVWLSARPGPATPGDGDGAAPPVEEEEAAPEEEAPEDAEDPPQDEDAEEQPQDEAADEESEQQPAEAEADAPQEDEASAEEAEPESVEAEVETPEQSAPLFQEGDRQVDARDRLEEATGRLGGALESAESEMRALEASTSAPEADVAESGTLGAPQDEADGEGAGARVARAEATLPTLEERTRTWTRQAAGNDAPASEITLEDAQAQPGDDAADARVRTPQVPLPPMGERTRIWTEEPEPAPDDDSEGGASLEAPEGDDSAAGSERVRSADQVGAESQGALQRAREQVVEAQPQNDDAGAP